MENKLNLDPQTILDKEFHVDFKGYSPAEVDEFLDSVIQDYQIYERKIGELGEKADGSGTGQRFAESPDHRTGKSAESHGRSGPELV